MKIIPAMGARITIQRMMCVWRVIAGRIWTVMHRCRAKSPGNDPRDIFFEKMIKTVDIQ